MVEVTLRVPAHTPTQPPVIGADGPTFAEGATYMALAPYPETGSHGYADLPGAWRVAVEPVRETGTRWPWRASLASAELAATWNRANLLLPSKAGETKVRVRAVVPPATAKLRVTLLRDGLEHDTREAAVP